MEYSAQKGKFEVVRQGMNMILWKGHNVVVKGIEENAPLPNDHVILQQGSQATCKHAFSRNYENMDWDE